MTPPDEQEEETSWAHPAAGPVRLRYFHPRLGGPGDARFEQEAKSALNAAWSPRWGYTAPNPARYPYQWLWDSCFHSIAWSALGDNRCVTEMKALLSGQLESGFLPNMLYHGAPDKALLMWFVRGHSTITQPPMYGYTLSVMAARGFDVTDLVAPATKAMNHLLDSRMDPATGLVYIVHPWESGCDDSPRWNRWMGARYARSHWNLTKFHLVRSLRLHKGEAVGSRRFEVCSASFNALVAYNARELATLTGDMTLMARADALVANIAKTWSPQTSTWCDLAKGGKVTSDLGTLESFLPLLVISDPAQRQAALSSLMDPNQFLRPFGFAGVNTSSEFYDPNAYWRGGSWPQLGYLLWQAVAGESVSVRQTVGMAALGASPAGRMSEYWNPETGAPLGAFPQSWSAALIDVRRGLTAMGVPGPGGVTRTPPPPAPGGALGL